MIKFLLRKLCWIKRLRNTKSTLIFYSPLGFRGNTRYLFELYSNQKLELIYLLNDRESDVVHKDYQLKRVLYLNELTLFQKFFLSLRCKFLILTHGYGKLPLYFSFLKVIQLWHGVPIKKVLLDCKKDTLKYENKILNSLYLLKYRMQLYSYNYIFVPKYANSKHFKSAFNKGEVSLIKGGNLASYKIASEASLLPNSKRNIQVLYAPTWRDGDNLIVECSKTLIKIFKRIPDLNLKIKVHPFEYQLLSSHLSSDECSFLIEEHADINEIISKFDLIISDFSSLLFDIKTFNMNTILYAPDYEQYISTREIYPEYIDYFNRAVVRSESELISAISREASTLSKQVVSKEVFYPKSLIALIEG